MATTPYDIVEIELQDGTKLTLKPASIKTLRKFMLKFEDLSKAESEDAAMDVLVELAGLLIEKQIPEVVSDKDALEDILDMPTVYKIIEVCGGVKLDDPKLIEQAMKAAAGTI